MWYITAINNCSACYEVSQTTPRLNDIKCHFIYVHSFCGSGIWTGHPWIGKIPWRRKWQPTPAFLLGESHGQRSLAGDIHGVAENRTQLNNSEQQRISGRSRDSEVQFLPVQILYALNKSLFVFIGVTLWWLKRGDNTFISTRFFWGCIKQDITTHATR